MRNLSRFAVAAAIAGLAVFGSTFASSTKTEAASCSSGRWLNKDGTCTQKGYVHCHSGKTGKGWQCPASRGCGNYTPGRCG
jgi:hypothetical protein